MIFAKDNCNLKFEKIDLSNETIREIEFEDCEFIECTFLETKFEMCRFLGCKFINCMLSATNITNSYFSEIFFLNSKAIGIDWTKARHMQGLNFDNCKIDYSNFRFLKINKMKIINSESKEVDFSGCELTESDFTNTDFEKTIFAKTNLTKVDFRKARNYYIDVKNNAVRGARFSIPEAMSLLNGLEILID